MSTPSSLVLCSTLGGNCKDVDVLIRSSALTFVDTGMPLPAYPRTGFAFGAVAVQFVDAATGVHYTPLEFLGGSFRIDATDNALDGATDTFGFTAYRMNGTVFHEAYIPASNPLPQSGTGSPTNQVQIGGGNITIQPL